MEYPQTSTVWSSSIAAPIQLKTPKTPRKKPETINAPTRLKLARPLTTRPRAAVTIPVSATSNDGTIAVVARM